MTTKQEQTEEIDDNLYPYLTLAARIPVVVQEPDDVATKIDGEIQLRLDYDGTETLAGKFRAYFVSLSGAHEYGFPLFDVLDADAHTAEYCAILGDPDEKDISQSWSPLAQELSDEAFGLNLLIVDQVKIEPQFRGKRLGLFAVRRLIETLGDSVGLVVIKPFPLQYCGCEDPDWIPPHGVTDKRAAIAAARAKLGAYWGAMGFREVGGGLMAFNPGLVSPNMEELAKVDWHSRKPFPRRRQRHSHRSRPIARS